MQSNYKNPKQPVSGENKYWYCQWYSSCYGTKNKNIKSEQYACLSDTSHVQRNLSRLNILRGKIRTISRKLGNDKKKRRVFQVTKNNSIHNRFRELRVEIVQTKTNCHSFICTPLKRWGNENNIQSESCKPICSVQSLQNERVSGGVKPDTETGLVMQSRFKCILLHSNMQRSKKVAKVSVQRTAIGLASVPRYFTKIMKPKFRYWEA